MCTASSHVVVQQHVIFQPYLKVHLKSAPAITALRASLLVRACSGFPKWLAGSDAWRARTLQEILALNGLLVKLGCGAR